MGKGYIQPWEPVVPAAQGIDPCAIAPPRGRTRAARAADTCQLRARAAGRVILQIPELYGNIISSALDVIIEPDDATDARARKF